MTLRGDFLCLEFALKNTVPVGANLLAMVANDYADVQV